MTKEEATQMQELIKRDKQEVKDLKEWSVILKRVETDEEEHLLDRFKAYKERVYCDNMITAKEAQLFAYANILKNMQNALK